MHDLISSENLTKETDALALAESLVITNIDEYRRADSFCVGLLALEKAIKADFKASKDAAHAAHKAICFQEATHLENLTRARALVKPKLVAYEAEVKRVAEENARIATEHARKLAEDRAVAEASEAENAGNVALANAIIDNPVPVTPVILTPVLERQTRIPEAWTFRVVDINAVPREYLCIDEKKLNGISRATKGTISVPGVVFYDRNA